MNQPCSVANKMEYIQKVFLGVQDFMRKIPELDELIAFLNAEPREFRSVSYESASMEIAYKDLRDGKGLDKWKTFYKRSLNEHTFHMDIGLGWAFAKNITSPDSYLDTLTPVSRCMVFDGMGYYHGLFKIRKTVINQLVPDGIVGFDLHGFDQGLGRRLWYIAKGDVVIAADSIQNFPIKRQPALWRGLGIACAYVGGNRRTDLELLLKTSGDFNKQLQTGIMLAAKSRNASNSITEGIENACKVLCNKTMEEIKILLIEN